MCGTTTDTASIWRFLQCHFINEYGTLSFVGWMRYRRKKAIEAKCEVMTSGGAHQTSSVILQSKMISRSRIEEGGKDARPPLRKMII